MAHSDPNRPITVSGNRPLAESTSSNGMVTGGSTIGGSETPVETNTSSQSAPNATSLWYAFRRRWLVAIILGIIGALVAVLGVLEFIPATYSASSLVEIRQPTEIPELGEPRTDLRIFRDNQAGIILSDPVLRAALARKELKDIPELREEIGTSLNSVTWLSKAIKVDFNQGPSLMSITMRGDNAKMLKALVNAVTNAYLEQVETGEKERLRRAKELLNSQKKNYREDLRIKTKLRNDALDSLNIPRPEVAKIRINQLDRQLEQARKSYSDLATEESKKQAELNSLVTLQKKRQEQPIPMAIMRQALKDDPVYIRLGEKVVEKAKEIEKYRDIANPNSPSTRARLNGLNDQLVQLQRGQDQYMQTQMSRVRSQLQDDNVLTIEKLKGELAAYKELKNRKQSDIDDLEDELNRLTSPPVNSELDSLEREIKSKEIALVELEKRYSALDTAPVGTNIRLIDEAYEPSSLDYSRQMKYGGVAALGMFGLIILGITLLEFSSRKINTPEEVSSSVGLNVIGILPKLSQATRKGLAADPNNKKYSKWSGILDESVDAIRTSILHQSRIENLQVIQISSATSGEGKSSVATHLASSLARAWKKTLLIDGDLRNPVIHKLLSKPIEPGFCEVVRGELPLEEAIEPTSVSRLWVMPAGQSDNHAIQALAQEGMASMFDELKQHYDFIIVDSSPLLPITDSLLLAQHMDAVVLTIMKEHSRLPAVITAKSKLLKLGIRILGTIMIGGESRFQSKEYPHK